MIRVYVSVFALKHGIHFCRPLDQITISWKKLNKDGLPVVLQNSRYVRKSDGRRLEIKEPTYEADNGIFQCVVEKGLNKQDTRNIELEVFSKSFHFSFLLLSISGQSSISITSSFLTFSGVIKIEYCPEMG